MNVPLITLVICATLAAARAAALSESMPYDREYEQTCLKFFEMMKKTAEMGGSTNVYEELCGQLIACGVTNITELDLRKDPTLYTKHMMRITFFEGYREEAERSGTNVYNEMRLQLAARGFTNVTEERLRLDPAFYVLNMGRIHASLPPSCLDWPPPDTDTTGDVRRFFEENKWSMPERTGEDMFYGRGTKPIVGLPWSAIANRTFDAYIRDGWVVVILNGPSPSFGPEHSGLLWSPKTTRPRFSGHTVKPLGKGWYAFVYPKLASDPEL
jgi:hypothetical protein